MAPTVTEDDLDGLSKRLTFPDDTVIRVFVLRTDDSAYPSGWAYTLHYGSLQSDPPRTLSDGTIRRYDNAHEDTKGHELHLAPDPEPKSIRFPGMVALWRRFWLEVPKVEFEVDV